MSAQGTQSFLPFLPFALSLFYKGDLTLPPNVHVSRPNQIYQVEIFSLKYLLGMTEVEQGGVYTLVVLESNLSSFLDLPGCL